MKNYELLKNQRNNDNLHHQNNVFKRRTVFRTNTFRCSSRQCKFTGKLMIMTNRCIRKNTYVNDKISIKNIRSFKKIKHDATLKRILNGKIITKVTKDLISEDILKLPIYKSLKDMLTREKNSEFGDLKKYFRRYS